MQNDRGDSGSKCPRRIERGTEGGSSDDPAACQVSKATGDDSKQHKTPKDLFVCPLCACTKQDAAPHYEACSCKGQTTQETKLVRERLFDKYNQLLRNVTTDDMWPHFSTLGMQVSSEAGEGANDAYSKVVDCSTCYNDIHCLPVAVCLLCLPSRSQSSARRQGFARIVTTLILRVSASPTNSRGFTSRSSLNPRSASCVAFRPQG